MKKFILHISIILAIIIIIANLLSYLGFSALRNSSFYKPSYAVNELKVSYDYIVLGSSVGLTNIDTNQIDSLTGLSGINLSMDDTGMSSHYLMLQHFLKQGKSIDFCVLAPTIRNYKKINERLSVNDYRFLMFNDSAYIKNFYSEFKGQRARILENSSSLPILGMAYYNIELFYPSIVSAIFPDRHNRFDKTGNYSYPVIKTKSPIIEKQQKVKLAFTNPWLHKIKKLCEENEIELIQYISPLKNTLVELDLPDTFTLNHSDKINEDALFYDKKHLNKDGRKKIGFAIAKELRPFLNTNNTAEE